MTHKLRFFILLTLSILFLILALVQTLGEITRYNASLAYYPPGTVIAGIPVGGLDAQAAGQRLIQAYSATQVELRISGNIIHVDPNRTGLQLDLQGMLQGAAMIRAQQPYWSGFWDFLWNRPPAPFEAPLACSVSTELLHQYLQEQISPRFDQPATPAHPVAGDVLFQSGQAGSTLDLTGAEEKLKAALCSLAPRVVELSVASTAPLPPVLDGLDPALEALTQVSIFDGMIEVYYQDLLSGREENFAYNQGRRVEPGIAFTGASTIKIPVMISAYKPIDGKLSDDLAQQMGQMIDLSDNGSTDEVMRRVLDPNIGPVEVTQDMQSLGLKNTFLAGFFYPGAPLLDRYQTPANLRADLTTDPDMYNQTTAADMGRLLAAIARCAENGSGPLVQSFGDKITQAECQEMAGLLAKNRKGVLIETGLPEGTRMAHKYGWVTDANDGLLHTTSDAAIIYSPGGDFILTVYLFHPQQLQWDTAQRLVAGLATTLYNFYNGWR